MRTAIIGSGISGLGAAYILHPHHDIVLYEKNKTLGGHARTIDVEMDGETIPVDTGFIVFNDRNYPLLNALFKDLNVPSTKSSMSFGVSIQDGWLEYGTESLFNLFGQRRNLMRSAYLKMLADILKFNKSAPRYLSDDRDITLGEALTEMNLGHWFRDYYLLAMGGAIWSSSLDQMLNFPAKSFIRFFENHGLLTVNDQPQWYTVTGGSREYIKRITAGLSDKIRTRTGVQKVIRTKEKITVIDEKDHKEEFDHVVFACHSDQTLNILDTPTQQENNVLGSFSYQKNKVIVHTDTSFMPKRRSCWSSWTYLSNTKAYQKNQIALSYWMNNLQPLETETPVFVTMNPSEHPMMGHILDEYEFEHPVFDQGAIDAQESLPALQGQNNTWHCGAYQRYGFHEDGLWSAVRMTKKMGVNPSWA